MIGHSHAWTISVDGEEQGRCCFGLNHGDWCALVSTRLRDRIADTVFVQLVTLGGERIGSGFAVIQQVGRSGTLLRGSGPLYVPDDIE